ncbi:hypothetical protein M3673_18800, partial [Nocardioides sp. P86]|nr:hypothetical protein [Nocardioides sp. P86]
SEIVLDRKVADKRIFPAMDILKSGTRKEDLLVPRADLQKIFVLFCAVFSRRWARPMRSNSLSTSSSRPRAIPNSSIR